MPADEEDGPERTCIVTRRKGAPETMIRFVLGPDLAVVPDLRRKLPGRGVWVTTSAATVAEAVRKNAFSRGFKVKVKAEAALADTVGDLMARDALQSLAMANKAGVVITGFAKVEAALGAGRQAAVLHATDGGDDGIRKLDALVRRRVEAGDNVASIKLFASQQLDLALGRTNVIHAALAAGPAGHAFLSRCHRLMSYRSPASYDLSADAKAAPA
jgi:predicted RNA-binding protein YlxR (DUF448 family)